MHSHTDKTHHLKKSRLQVAQLKIKALLTLQKTRCHPPLPRCAIKLLLKNPLLKRQQSATTLKGTASSTCLA